METKSVLIKGLITNFIFSGILFLCAGRVDYIQGWIFLFANILATIMNFLAIPTNSDLIHERSKIGEGVKSWDKLLLGLSAITYLIIIVIAGLDSGRFFWTKNFNWVVAVSGGMILICGQILFLTARKQNRFFSSMVRIQKDRGHMVCDTGLYKIIRHPGYLGMILSLTGIPFITTSKWSSIPVCLAIVLLLIRTHLEDQTLKLELDGYEEYSKKTNYRMIPYIW